jgi:diguanylate cyclase (GGDEF)-like protein/PAS domain S-box-containing protein
VNEELLAQDSALVRELRRTMARMELALGQISDGLVICDGAGQILWCNTTFEQFTGQPRLLLMGRPLVSMMERLLPSETRLDLATLLNQRPEGGVITAVARREPLQVIEIEWRPVLSEQPVPYVFRFQDVSDRVSLEELRLRSKELLDQQLTLAAQVVTCPVTGLPNRRGLLQALDSALDRLEQQPGWLAVLFCDLNRFKEVNDIYGHRVGDQLLVGLAQRMQRALRPDDVVSRLGGDEFVLLCCNLTHPDEALFIARRLLQMVSMPWSPPESDSSLELQPEMSVGLVLCNNADRRAEQLLHDADLAMYEAKRSRSREPVVFDAVMDSRLLRRQEIRDSLRRALRDRQLGLHLQPVVRLADGVLVAVEAFCRPIDAAGEPIPPREFIAEAELSGLIGPLGQLMLEQCFSAAQALRLQERGLSLAVNFSTHELARAGFADEVIALACAHAIPPQMLTIEVTETALIDQPQRTRSELARLREAGFRLVLDDFGIGYSSFNSLADLPIDGFKIDQSFTSAMADDPRRRLLIGAILKLARDLDLEAVAEGVESCEQRQMLLDMGCSLAQGYLFSHPAPLEQAKIWPVHLQPLHC